MDRLLALAAITGAIYFVSKKKPTTQTAVAQIAGVEAVDMSNFSPPVAPGPTYVDNTVERSIAQQNSHRVEETLLGAGDYGV